MSSNIKIILVLAVLLAVIFGVTFIATNTPTVEVEGPKVKSPESAGLQPLKFLSAEVQWDPSPEASSANRAFPGFFEPGTDYGARFWFYNANPTPMTLQLKEVSCTSCSAGAVAVVPQGSWMNDHLANLYAVSLLPFGTFPTAALGASIGEALFEKSLTWERKAFKDEPHASFRIPAAPPGGVQWAILELHFMARPPMGPKTLESTFIAWPDQDPQAQKEHRFAIRYIVAPPFDVIPPTINAGEFSEGSTPRKYEVRLWSATRTPEQFPPPYVQVRDRTHTPLGETDLVTVSPLEPLTPEQRNEMAKTVGKILSGYRMIVTAVPKTGVDALDIGPIDRLISITAPNVPEGNEKKVDLKAHIKGEISLAGGAAIMDLGTPNPRKDFSKTFTLTTDSPNLELMWDKEQTFPPYLQAEVMKKPDSQEFSVTVKVPAGYLFGPMPKESVVVFQILKGDKPRRVRIPITGQGIIR